MRKTQMFQPQPTATEWLLSPIAFFFKTLHGLVKRQPIVKILEASREAYINHPERLEMVAFEKEVKAVREAVAKGHIQLHHLQPDMMEWASFDRSVFYNQLYLLYYNRQMFPDAKRVYKESLKGVNITISSRDGKVSETVNADYGKPINLEM